MHHPFYFFCPEIYIVRTFLIGAAIKVCWARVEASDSEEFVQVSVLCKNHKQGWIFDPLVSRRDILVHVNISEVSMTHGSSSRITQFLLCLSLHNSDSSRAWANIGPFCDRNKVTIWPCKRDVAFSYKCNTQSCISGSFSAMMNHFTSWPSRITRHGSLDHTKFLVKIC